MPGPGRPNDTGADCREFGRTVPVVLANGPWTMIGSSAPPTPLEASTTKPRPHGHQGAGEICHQLSTERDSGNGGRGDQAALRTSGDLPHRFLHAKPRQCSGVESQYWLSSQGRTASEDDGAREAVTRERLETDTNV